MTDFSFLDKDDPSRIYYRDHPNADCKYQMMYDTPSLCIHGRDASGYCEVCDSVDGDDFCMRCGLPLHQCNCKSRRDV